MRLPITPLGNGRQLGTVVLLGGIYFVAAKLGLKLAFYHPSVTPVWLPTGIALASLLLLGYNAWPGIFLGALLANLTTLGTIWTSLGIAAGNTLEALVATYLTNKYANGSNAFARAQDILKFAVLGTVVSTTVSSTIGVTSLALSGFAQRADYQPIWLTWWLGDAAGALIVTPFIVLWSKHPYPRWDAHAILERALFLLLLLAVGRIVFGGMFPFAFLTVPFLVWPAFRFGLRETATVIALLSVIAIGGTAKGLGPFAAATPNDALLLLDTFLGIMVTVALPLASVAAERKRGEETQRFLADASTLLAEPLDPRTSLSRVAQLVVPRLADWCAIDLVEEDGSVRTVAMSHQDPARRTLAQQLEECFPPDTQAPDGNANVVRTGHAELYSEIPDVLFASVAPCPGHNTMLRNNGVKSAMVVPLLARGRTIGALTLVSVESGRHYGAADLWLAEELGRRAALAIDSSRVYEQMEQMLKRSERRNSLILESALDCIVTLDHTGKIIEFNRAAQATFRCSREEAMGRYLAELTPPLAMRNPPDYGLFPHLATGESTILAKRFEVTAKRLDGTMFPAELSIVRVPGEDPPVFTCFLRDITERKEAETALKISSERLRLLIEQVPAMIWTTDTNLRFTTVQGAALSNLGLRVEEFIGKTVLDRIADDEGESSSAAAHLEALRGTSRTYELFRAGRAYHCCVEPLFDLAGTITGVIGVGLDVTERKQTEVAIREYAERLRLLSRELVEVQERVQQTVARELHDDIGQILTALRLILLKITMTEKAAGMSVKLHEANSLVDEIQRRVRDLSLTLRPPELDDLGLLPALLMHCSRFSAQTSVQVAVEHSNVDARRFSSVVETAAYRIVQEALTNVARHAGASQAKVRVWATEDTIGVQVEDPGSGFDPEATLMAHRSNGLAGMYERVQLLGGHLTVESRPGRGTKITADLPYQSTRIEGATTQ